MYIDLHTKDLVLILWNESCFVVQAIVLLAQLTYDLIKCTQFFPDFVIYFTAALLF